MSALYGYTKYDGEDANGNFASGMTEKELNLSAGYNFTKDLNASLMYVKVNADKNQDYSNYNKYLASVEYKF